MNPNFGDNTSLDFQETNPNVVARVNGVSYMDQNLQPSTNYVYSVAAFDAAGHVSHKSRSVHVRTLGTKDKNR